MMFILPRVSFKCRTLPGCQILRELRLGSDDCASRPTVPDNFSLLKKLGFSDDESNMLITNKYVSKLTPKELTKLVATLQKLGFAKEDFLIKYPNILHLHPYVIDHRFKAMEEGGILVNRITLQFIYGYPSFSVRRISELKETGLVDKTINVARNILSHCDLPTHLYPSETDETQSYKSIQIDAVKCYLRWKFDLNKEEIDYKSKIYNIKCRSIRLIKQNFDILTNKLEFPKEKIGRHIYLLNTHPENMLDTLRRVPIVDVTPIKVVAFRFPKILMRPTDKLLETIQVLKDCNVDEKNVALHPEIFTLAPETVRSRINLFSTDPQYKSLVHNTRLYKALTTFRDLTDRSKILKASKWRCFSADILSTGRQVFNERYKLKPDYYRGCDIVHFLHKEMEMPREDVRKVMSQHVLWHYVPLITIYTTLEFLRQAGFSHAQLTSAMPIILYPKSEVEKCIKNLDSDPEVDCCRDPASGKVRPEMVLQLVLYYLERPFHFSGNGVWELDPPNTDQPQ